MNSEQSARVRGSDPPLGHRLHTVAGVIGRELTRRMINNQLAAGVHKTEDKTSPSVSNGKNSFFFRFERIP